MDIYVRDSYMEKKNLPWPTIIILVIGSVLLIYIAVGPNINSVSRWFGISFILLWTLAWALTLFVLSHNGNITAWYLMVVGVIIIVTVFILTIIRI